MSETDERFNARNAATSQSLRFPVTQWAEIVRRAEAGTDPILIYGPTASGKSELALRLAERFDAVIVNADASQIWSNWQVLTARPGADDVARAPHALYGHLPFDATYSAGHWLREVTPRLTDGTRPILVGGTGLYFKALTEGLVAIPEIPATLRLEADTRRLAEGHESLLAEIDAETRGRIDTANPMRVQRAWEVYKATGRGLAAWQADTPPPVLPLSEAVPIQVSAPADWLTPRIAQRCDVMLAEGALEEARTNAPIWSPDLLSMKVIGAQELIAHVQGDLPLETARERTIVATRQYAKRQRTWGRARMQNWLTWDPQIAF